MNVKQEMSTKLTFLRPCLTTSIIIYVWWWRTYPVRSIRSTLHLSVWNSILIPYPHPSLLVIFESILNDCLTKHLDNTCLFSDLQYGFRAFRSNAGILTVLSERIYNSLDAGGETRAVALDISKAFDKVWHAGFLHKLKVSWNPK